MKDIIQIYRNEPALFELNENVDRHEGELKSAKEDEGFLNDVKP